MVAEHNLGEDVLTRGGEERQPAHGAEDRRYAREDGTTSARARSTRAAPFVLHQSVCDDEEREAAMPEHIQPGSALGAGAKQAGRREQPREREGVRDGHESGEQIAAGQHEQRPGLQKPELTEEQHRGHQIVDHERRFIDWDEGRDLSERDFGERRSYEKNDDGHQDDR